MQLVSLRSNSAPPHTFLHYSCSSLPLAAGQFEAALVLCGRKPRYDIFPEIKDMIRSLDAPVLHVSRSTYKAMEAIQFFTPKLNIDDTSRIESAVGHYEPFIDFDTLLRRTSAVSDTSFDEPDERSVGGKRRW